MPLRAPHVHIGHMDSIESSQLLTVARTNCQSYRLSERSLLARPAFIAYDAMGRSIRLLACVDS